MRSHFHAELDELQAAVLKLGEAVCTNVVQAVEAFRADDRDMAAHVMRADLDIDRREVRNEEDCLKIIALSCKSLTLSRTYCSLFRFFRL